MVPGGLAGRGVRMCLWRGGFGPGGARWGQVGGRLGFADRLLQPTSALESQCIRTTGPGFNLSPTVRLTVAPSEPQSAGLEALQFAPALPHMAANTRYLQVGGWLEEVDDGRGWGSEWTGRRQRGSGCGRRISAHAHLPRTPSRPPAHTATTFPDGMGHRQHRSPYACAIPKPLSACAAGRRGQVPPSVAAQAPPLPPPPPPRRTATTTATTPFRTLCSSPSP